MRILGSSQPFKMHIPAENARIAVEQDPGPPGVKVLLVHGVGLPSAHLFGSQLQENIKALRLQPDPVICPLDWHSSVEKPFTDASIFNPRYTSQLMRGLIGFASTRHRYFAARMLHFVLFTVPIAIWLLVALALHFLNALFQGSAPSSPSLQTALWFPRLASGIVWKAIAWPLPPLFYSVGSHALWIYFWLIVACSVALWLVVSLREGIFGGFGIVGTVLLKPLVFSASLIRHPLVIAFWVFSALCASLVAVMDPDRQIQVLRDKVFQIVPLEPVSVSSRFLLSYVAGSIGFAVAIWTAYVVADKLTILLKIIADVACYLGDADYAKAMRNLVSEHVNGLKLKTGDHLVLVGHSLGSVILADWLRRPDRRCLNPNLASVTLVTLGSPLKHFVARFCPGIFPSPDELAAQFSKSLRGFSWLNVYRPFDPIGTSLFLPESCSAEDVSTCQFKKFLLGAHSDYWDDQKVLSIVKKRIGSLWAQSTTVRKDPALEFASPPNLDGLSASREIAFFKHQSRWLSTALAVLIGIAFGWLTVNVTSASFKERREFEDHAAYREYLIKAGVTAKGWLYHFSRIEGFGGPNGNTTPVLIDYYLVVFPYKDKYIGYPIDDQNYHWRVSGIEDRSSPWENAPVGSDEFFSEVNRPSTRLAVNVRYLADDPKQFDIAELDLRPPSPGLKMIGRLAEAFLIVLFACFIAVYIGVVAKSQVAAYCGARPRGLD
jgi:hypothetical protein